MTDSKRTKRNIPNRLTVKKQTLKDLDLRGRAAKNVVGGGYTSGTQCATVVSGYQTCTVRC